jgi:hypothetical protein
MREKISGEGPRERSPFRNPAGLGDQFQFSVNMSSECLQNGICSNKGKHRLIDPCNLVVFFAKNKNVTNDMLQGGFNIGNSQPVNTKIKKPS